MTNFTICGIVFAIPQDGDRLLQAIKYMNSKMNALKKYRENLLLSKAELARKAGVSILTIDRVERGKSCRLETKRKIILALGLKLSERGKIFGDGK